MLLCARKFDSGLFEIVEEQDFDSSIYCQSYGINSDGQIIAASGDVIGCIWDNNNIWLHLGQ